MRTARAVRSGTRRRRASASWGSPIRPPGAAGRVSDSSALHRAGNNADGAVDELEYSAEKGFGFLRLSDSTARGEWARFGQFDDCPNSRARFSDTCPEELFDSFVGFKDHPTPCNESVVGNTEDPCLEGDMLPNGSPY